MSRPEWLTIVVGCAGAVVAFVTTGWVAASAVTAVFTLLAIVIWLRKRAERSSRIDWPALEARFKELRTREIAYGWSNHVPRQVSAAQVADGNGRQRWMLFGPSADLNAEAERLFCIAGRCLVSSGFALSQRLQREQDDFSRWLWFVVEVGRHEKDVGGSSFSPKRGRIETYTYWLRNVIDDSSACCVEALRMELAPGGAATPPGVGSGR